MIGNGRTTEAPPWVLSVDVGTTATAAAIGIGDARRVVELDGRAAMPSAVLAPEQGPLVVGAAAEAQAALHPERVERTPKRRLGDAIVLLGDRAVEPVEAVAAILGHVASAAIAEMGGQPPAGLVLTHPARWGAARTGMLRDAAQRCGLPEPTLVAEPVAAAAHLAGDLAAPGDLLAVYDFGGGTLDVAIIRRTAEGFEVAGPPGGDEALGGEVLDDRIVEHLLGRVDPAVGEQLRASEERVWQQARLQLRRDARAAKEALSGTGRYQWYSGAPVDTELTLDVEELEAIIAAPVTSTMSALVDTVRRAGLAPESLRTVVMVGGSARTPLVGRMLTEATGRPPTTWGDPKSAVCLGALTVALQAPDAREPEPQEPQEPEPHEPEPHEPEPQEEVPLEHLLAVPLSPDPPVRPEPADSATGRDQGTASPPPDRSPRPDEPTWSARRIGATIAVGLVSLGIVSAILAVLVR